MESAINIAKWFVNRAAQDAEAMRGEYMTNLKLQKLLYYAQGMYSARYGSFLFEDDIINLQYGPVIPNVLNEYSKYRGSSIEEKYPDIIDDEYVIFMLELVYKKFGQFSASKLVQKTHREPPWKNTKRNEVISKESIQDYFISKYEQPNADTLRGLEEANKRIEEMRNNPNLGYSSVEELMRALNED